MQPEVIDGAREPRSVRGFADPSKRGPGPAGIPEGKRIFQATHNRYRLQLTAPETIRTSDGRTIKGEKPLNVQFDDRVCVLDIEKDARKIELMVQDPFYGVDFWDFADVLKRSKEARVQQAVDTVLAYDGEARQRIIDALRASGEDFPLPTPTKKVDPAEGKTPPPAK